MVGLLERVRARYGSMRGYVRAIGVCNEDVTRLEQRLLDPH